MSVAEEIQRFYVTPSWVADHYGVERWEVYRAIRAGKLEAIKVKGGSLVLDIRDLPLSWPS